MLNKLRTFLKKLVIDDEYNEHQKRMKEIEKQYENIMQEVIDIQKSIEKSNENILEFIKQESVP